MLRNSCTDLYLFFNIRTNNHCTSKSRTSKIVLRNAFKKLSICTPSLLHVTILYLMQNTEGTCKQCRAEDRCNLPRSPPGSSAPPRGSARAAWSFPRRQGRPGCRCRRLLESFASEGKCDCCGGQDGTGGMAGRGRTVRTHLLSTQYHNFLLLVVMLVFAISLFRKIFLKVHRLFITLSVLVTLALIPPATLPGVSPCRSNIDADFKKYSIISQSQKF